MGKCSVCGKDRSLPSDSRFKISATETIISATIMNDGTWPSGRKVISRVCADCLKASSASPPAAPGVPTPGTDA
jgi:hypothetical protein